MRGLHSGWLRFIRSRRLRALWPHHLYRTLQHLGSRRTAFQNAFNDASTQNRECPLSNRFTNSRRNDGSHRFLRLLVFSRGRLGMLQQSRQQCALTSSKDPLVSH